MAIKVKATKMGYVYHRRIREGDVFMIDEKDCKKDANGKIVLPNWVVGLAGSDEKKGKGRKVIVEEPEELFTDEVI